MNRNKKYMSTQRAEHSQQCYSWPKSGNNPSSGEQINWCMSLLLCTAATAKSLQSCLTLCNPIDGNPPGSAIPGTLQARTLAWVAISFSNAWKWKWSCSVMSDLATPRTAAYQAPPSMGFSRQEYWSGFPLPSPRSVSQGSGNKSKNKQMVPTQTY